MEHASERKTNINTVQHDPVLGKHGEGEVNLSPLSQRRCRLLSPARLGHAIGTIGNRLEGPIGRLLYLRLSILGNYAVKLA
jgi:hypothetical protein